MTILNEMLGGLDQTGMLSVLCLFAMLNVFLSGFFILLYFRNNTRLKEIHGQLKSLKNKMQSFQQPESPNSRNENQLDKEELKSRFNKVVEDKTIPEKYRHIAQLEGSGLGVKEISEILDVSRYEAEQMISLARLSRAACY
jgi:hypothetical protein